MRKLTITIVVLMLSAFSVSPLYSQGTIDKVGQTGLQFLKLDVTARAAAMGGAYSMIGEDASATFINPAGLSHMDAQYDAIFARTNWIADIAYNAGAIAANLGNIGTFGLSFIASDYGDIAGTQVASNTQGFTDTGNLDVGAYAIGLSYARQLNDKFSVGTTFKWASQHLGSSELSSGEIVDNKTSGIAVDFGSIFYPGYIPSLRLGMNIRNFSQQFVYQEEEFDLPLTFRIGVAVDAFDFFGGMDNSVLNLSVDALHPRDYTERLHIGAEYIYMNMFALRGGVKTNYNEESLTLGFGINYEITNILIRADYAYAAMDVFTGVNRIDLGISF